MKFLAAFAIFLSLSIVGCRPVTAPLPKGAINNVDDGINADLQAAQAGLVQYQADVNAGKHKPGVQEKAIVNDLAHAYNAAYPIYQAWHKQLVADPSTPIPGQLTTLLGAITGDLQKIDTFIVGIK